MTLGDCTDNQTTDDLYIVDMIVVSISSITKGISSGEVLHVDDMVYFGMFRTATESTRYVQHDQMLADELCL